MKTPIAIIISGIVIASAIIISGNKPKYVIKATESAVGAFSKDGLAYKFVIDRWVRLQDGKEFDKLP